MTGDERWEDASPAKSEKLADDASGQKALPFHLTGSQAKTAFAIRQNCEAMIRGNARGTMVKRFNAKLGRDVVSYVATEADNLNRTAFLTLTVGNDTPEGFEQVWDAGEASRRINNLNRHVLPDLFERAIVVTERHKNGAIHFHLLGTLRNRADIRTGFDFDAMDAANKARSSGRVNRAAETRYKLSASSQLLDLWATLRDVLPRYGFGRAQLTPIKKTGEAVACYVSKYIEKNICNRRADDKRKKLVRYLGWHKSQLKPNEFSWASKRARAWRGKARETAGLIGVDRREDCAAALGPRWAMHLSTTWQGRTVDDLSPFLVCDYSTRRLLTNDLAKVSKKKAPGWLDRRELPFRPRHATLCEVDLFALPGIEEARKAFFESAPDAGWFDEVMDADIACALVAAVKAFDAEQAERRLCEN